MNEVSLSRIDLAIMRETFKRARGLPVWTITGILGISIRDAADSYRKLRNLGFVGEKDGAIRLLAIGRNWVLSNQEQFAFSGKKTWRDVPEEFNAGRIAPFKPYAPKVSRLDRSKFRFGRSK